MTLDPALLGPAAAIRELIRNRPAPSLGGLQFKRKGDWLYSGDPRRREIGDARIRFASAPEGQVSLLAAREDGRLVPYAAGAAAA